MWVEGFCFTFVHEPMLIFAGCGSECMLNVFCFHLLMVFLVEF
jgi:hypothetical protein